MPSWPYRVPDAAWASGTVSLLAVGVYLSTLMWNITGSDSAYAEDVGEYQVALPLWGTVHPTGTPLYMLLGSPFVAVLRWLGVSPSAGASLFSLVCEAGSVALVAIILVRLTSRPLLSIFTALTIGLTRSIWIHGSIAEVYSLWLFLALLALLISLDLQVGWSDKKGWMLAFVAGLGVAHHRLFAPLLPIIVFWLWRHWPRGRQLWRWGSVAALFSMAGFLPYVDMVLRARSGTKWMYGSPGTWDGFWTLFWAREYSGLQRPLSSGIEYVAALTRTVTVMAHELDWLGLLVVGAAAPFAMQRSTRRVGLLFLTISTVYLAFAIAIAEANLFEKVAMPAVLGLLVTAALGLDNLSERYPGLQYPFAGVMLILASFLFLTNRPKILDISRDPSGLETIAQLDDLNAPALATIMSPWGRHHFALAYAMQVEERIPVWRLVHHAADLRAVLESEEVIFTHADTIYGFGVDWWAKTIDTRPYLSAAGPGWVAVSKQPMPMTADHVTYKPLGDNFLLRGWSFQQSAAEFAITLCWQVARPVGVDYSTFTHLATRPVVTEPGQLVASSDHDVPVDGWHPTSRWLPEETVCDAHKISLAHDADFQYVIAGMYTRGDDGSFHRLGSLTWERDAGTWMLARRGGQQ